MFIRLRIQSFEVSHFDNMTLDEVTVDVCEQSSWIGLLKMRKPKPLLDHKGWKVLATHYLVSVYWTIVVIFRLG